jgi:uncharacterized membrane protein
VAAEPATDEGASTARTATRFSIANTILAVAGVGVSVYLTWAHYTSAKNLACSDKGTINCLKVTTSSYSKQFGIPLAVLGLGFFVVTLALQNPWAWRSTSQLIRRARLAVAAGGAVMVLWLLWVELFKLDAICLYCSAVHVLSVLIFISTGLGTAATAPLPDAFDDDDDDEEEEEEEDEVAPLDDEEPSPRRPPAVRR